MVVTRWLHSLSDGLLDLVFAPVCVACAGAISASDTNRIICRLCWARARPVPAPQCSRCGEPLSASASRSDHCAVCDGLPPGVRSVRSAFLMAEPASGMVHALKYRGWEAAAAPMAERLARISLPPDVADEARIVVPVPTSAARRRQRGYNQAELLADCFARTTQRFCLPGALVRTRATETQTALHPDERRANVAGAFAVPPEHTAELQREHLLLIDDVWTTGATASACAEALLAGGARAVSVITFARALGGALRHARIDVNAPQEFS
jgi:ComF family protein